MAAEMDPLDNFIQTLFDSIQGWTENFLSSHYSALGSAVAEPALYVAMAWVAVKLVNHMAIGISSV